MVQLRQRSLGFTVARRVFGGKSRWPGDEAQSGSPTTACARQRYVGAARDGKWLAADRNETRRGGTYVRRAVRRGVEPAQSGQRGVVAGSPGVAVTETRVAEPRRGRLLRLVDWYQRAFAGCPSPCRFTPSCSSYAREALEIHGSRRGLWLTIRRLARCRPFGPSGFDPVPQPGTHQLPMGRVRGHHHGPTSPAISPCEGSMTQ